MRSTFDDLVRGGRPVWIKIVACAVATPILFVIFWLRGMQSDGKEMEFTSNPKVYLIGGTALVVIGALIGAALSLRDIVKQRLIDNRHESLPLKLLFGYGYFSVLVWILLGIIVPIGLAILEEAVRTL